MIFDPADPLGLSFQKAIENKLADFLAARRAGVVGLDAALAPLADQLIPLALGGKHIRPGFVWWGYVAAAGEPPQPGGLLQLAAALDLVHAGLLAHDDLIDAADTRRGRPSLHRAVAGLAPAPDDVLGTAGAVVGGALLLQWGQEAADESGLLSPAARNVFNQLRRQVLAGQLADAWAAAGLPLFGPGGTAPLSQAAAVAEIDELKTASYTVTGPVQLGAVAGGASEPQLAGLANFGHPLGRAFQARDDVLDVFGDEITTGKPAGDDLRQGKATALVQSALEMAGPAGAAELRAVLGNRAATADELAKARQIIVDCGALATVEKAITSDLAEALAALDKTDLQSEGKAGLISLAEACIHRDR